MTTHARLRDARGAIIIHVAIALLALIAFSAFVVDMGAMWVSRGHAQNAADAGALAGAVALMKDGGSPRRPESQRFSGRIPTPSSATRTLRQTSALRSPAPRARAARHATSPAFRRVSISLGACAPTSFGIRRIVRTAAARRSVRPCPRSSDPWSVLPSRACAPRRPRKSPRGIRCKCMLPFAVIDRWADNYDPTPVTTLLRQRRLDRHRGMDAE